MLKEERDMFEIPALGCEANLCHALLIGKLEIVHRPESKWAEFILTGVNFTAKMILLVSKGTRVVQSFKKLQL